MELPQLRNVRFFFSVLGRRRVAILLACSLLNAVLEVFSISAIVPFISVLSDVSLIRRNPVLAYFHERGGFNSDEAFLVFLGLAVIGLIVVKNGVTALVKRANFRYSFEAQHLLSTLLLESYLRRDYEYFTRADSSQLLRNVASITGSLVTGLLIPALLILSDGLMLLGIFAMLLAVDPKVTLSLVLGFGLVAGVSHLRLRRRVTRLGAERDRVAGEIYQVLSHALQGIRDVKILGKERFFADQFRELSETLTGCDNRYQYSVLLPPLVLETLGLSGIVLVVLYLIRSGTPLPAIIPAISFYVLAAYRLLPAMNRISPNLYSLRFYSVSMNRLRDDLAAAAAEARDGSFRGEEPAPLLFERGFALEGVGFRYQGASAPALEGVSFEVRKNTTIGLVGESGGGKTTLVDILAGLYLPERGRLLVDGHPLAPEELRRWRRNIGYVPQQIFLADASIAANIAFGVSEQRIDRARVEAAVKAAQLQALVAAQPEGLDTKIGERGVRLSGGQRQRIGIARAFYHDPQVLILDEATAALDSLTEAEIVDEIARLGKIKTVVVVAHRFTTIRQCDWIYVMDKGRLAAQGTYDELMAKSELFRGLANAPRGTL